MSSELERIAREAEKRVFNIVLRNAQWENVAPEVIRSALRRAYNLGVGEAETIARQWSMTCGQADDAIEEATAASIEEAIAHLRLPDDGEGSTIDDGFGGEWDKCGPDCSLHVVRPGKTQCERDGRNCPDREGGEG